MKSDPGFLHQLELVIQARRGTAPDQSYTASLLAAGRQRLAQKVGEEAVELALAGVGDERTSIVAETADLLYHVLVLLAACDVSLDDVLQELERRHRS